METLSTYILQAYPNTLALFERLVPFILILVAVVVTVLVQWRHAGVQRNRLGVELFDKRYEFLQLVRNITSISLSNDARYFERIQKDYSKFVQYRLLFPNSIAKAVDRMLENCDELLISSRNVDAFGHEETPRQTAEDENDALKKQIRSQMEALQKRLEDFIRIDWKG